MVGLGIPPCSCSGYGSYVQRLTEALDAVGSFLSCECMAKTAVGKAVRGFKPSWVLQAPMGKNNSREANCLALLPAPPPQPRVQCQIRAAGSSRAKTEKNPHAPTSCPYWGVIISAITSKVRTEKSAPHLHQSAPCVRY